MLKRLNQLPFLLPLLVLLISPTFLSLLRPGFFSMQDDLQAFRIFEMDKCFQDLQLPCRWVPDMGYGYGYPQFNFYSPSVFYLGEIFHLFGFQFIDSVKLLLVLGFIVSSLTMFLFLRTIWGNSPAFIGALLYSYVPFKAVQVYIRGSVSEFWALVIFPLLFWASYQWTKTRDKKYGLYLAFSIGLMLLTHNLLSVLILPVVGIWCLVLLALERKWKTVPFLVGFVLLGLGLASFFVLPALLEKQYVHTETLLSGYFDYRQHFVPLDKLFLSNEWGYGSSNLGQTEKLNLSTGIVQWVLGLGGFLLSILFYKKDKVVAGLAIAVGFLELLTLFMIHQKSTFIWEHLPFLAWLQFPWRFLALSVFFLSFLGAAAVYFLNQRLKIIAVVIIIAVVLLNAAFFNPKDWLNISDQDKFSGSAWEKQLTISIFDYLPIYAKLPPNHKAPPQPEVLDGQAYFADYKKGSDYQQGLIVVSKDATLRLPLFDFPGMVVTANRVSTTSGNEDNLKISHWHDDCRGQTYCLGLVTFKLQTGTYDLKTQLTNTPIRIVGNSLSLISLVILISLVLIWRKRLQ